MHWLALDIERKKISGPVLRLFTFYKGARSIYAIRVECDNSVLREIKTRRLPGSSLHGILQAKILERVAIPSPGELTNPGIKPRYPALQADTLPSERDEIKLQFKGLLIW